METPNKRVPLKRRLVALLLVIAGAVCLIAGKSDAAGQLNTPVMCGIGLMLAGIIVRLTGKRA